MDKEELFNYIDENHKDLLTIIADPKDDTVFFYHNGIKLCAKIKKGEIDSLIKESDLTEKEFSDKIDKLIHRITITLKASIFTGYVFFGVFKEYLFKIAKVGDENKTKKEHDQENIKEALEEKHKERIKEGGDTNLS